MLRNNIDLRGPLVVVLYLRMSSDKQNPRSPEQQQDTIEATIKRLGLPWTIAKVFADRGFSGQFNRKRPEFQRMLGEIRSGEITPDAIAVDTFERFGRNDELASVRHELEQQHGVLILTADTQFADPTSIPGKAMAAFENLRATEENRIKAHNVLRGKRDTARLGHWPGGKPPLGYKLQSVFSDKGGRQEVDHCLLVPDPESDWIIKLIFQRADELGEGCTRIARALNDDPTIHAKFKPFSDQTVNCWLKSPIYLGQLVWEKRATGVVNDRRVSQRNAESDLIIVPGFCEPLISKEQWDRVQELRKARKEKRPKGRKSGRGSPDKQIRATAPGLALKYPLSGLVCCGTCRRAMNISTSPSYRTKAGEDRQYASYSCPGYISRVCTNGKRIPEAWLREKVVELIFKRLFQTDC